MLFCQNSALGHIGVQLPTFPHRVKFRLQANQHKTDHVCMAISISLVNSFDFILCSEYLGCGEMCTVGKYRISNTIQHTHNRQRQIF